MMTDEEEGKCTRDVGEEGEDDVEEEVASASADQQNLLEEAVKTIFRIVEYKMKVKSHETSFGRTVGRCFTSRTFGGSC